jgi:flagellar basal body-associated protein FliL
MSDHAEKKEEGGEKPAKKGGIGALLTKLPVLLGGVMIIEAFVLFAGFKMIAGGPAPAAGSDIELTEHGAGGAHGAEGGHGDAPAVDDHGNPIKKVDPKAPAEVEVLSIRASNRQSGRTFFYDVQIKIITRASHEEKVKSSIAAKAGLIQDRIRTIIAQSEPAKLQGEVEPGLETLKRQVKYQLDEIIGEGFVEEVLVHCCVPFRTDF